VVKRPSRRVFKNRAADGSVQLSDDDRLKLIEKAFQECGVKPSKLQVARQFLYETGRKVGEPMRSYRRGNKPRMW
jgi:hypothetical protein